MREIQFASLLRTKELEIQLQMAKMEELKKAQATELSKSHQLTRQVSTFSQTENELRSQLNIYVEKFKQVSISHNRIIHSIPNIYTNPSFLIKPTRNTPTKQQPFPTSPSPPILLQHHPPQSCPSTTNDKLCDPHNPPYHRSHRLTDAYSRSKILSITATTSSSPSGKKWKR